MKYQDLEAYVMEILGTVREQKSEENKAIMKSYWKGYYSAIRQHGSNRFHMSESDFNAIMFAINRS